MGKTTVFIGIMLMSVSLTGFATGKSGKQIYEQACQSCHAKTTAATLKAPATHDKAMWDARFKAADVAVRQDKNYKTAIDYLVAQVKNGKGIMPAGGTCIKCTDDEYKAAIIYMSGRKQQ